MTNPIIIEDTKENVLTILIAVPGHDKNSINMHVKGRFLYVHAKNDLKEAINGRVVSGAKSFDFDVNKQFELRESYVKGEISAEVRNGLLKIVILEAENVPKEIEIT